MQPQLINLFENAENRYLGADELKVLSHYVDSVPVRMQVYRHLRDREIDMMQTVADQLQTEFSQESVEILERAIKIALLSLRYAAMGMLLNDEYFVKERLTGWLSGTIGLYNTPIMQSINSALYRLLHQQLSSVLNAQEMGLLSPFLTQAQALIHEPVPTSVR